MKRCVPQTSISMDQLSSRDSLASPMLTHPLGADQRTKVFTKLVHHLINYLPTFLLNNQQAPKIISGGAMVASELVALRILCSIPGRGEAFLFAF